MVILIPILPYFVILYDRHKCQEMTFHDIHNRHEMSFPIIKVLQYGFQNNCLELTIKDVKKICVKIDVTSLQNPKRSVFKFSLLYFPL